MTRTSTTAPGHPPATGPDAALIQLQGVHRRYAMSGQTVHALAGVDLDIAAGEFIALTGPSGSGKSSLLNILGCLDHPDGGRYLIEGLDAAQLDPITALRHE